MPKKRLKSIPRFRTEAEERQFWVTHDTVDYIDWSKAKRAVFPNLRPSTETISLRLPAPLLADLKTLANERDVPYQSLLKVYLAEQVRQEQAAAGQHNPRLQLTGRPPYAPQLKRRPLAVHKNHPCLENQPTLASARCAGTAQRNRRWWPIWRRASLRTTTAPHHDRWSRYVSTQWASRGTGSSSKPERMRNCGKSMPCCANSGLSVVGI